MEFDEQTRISTCSDSRVQHALMDLCASNGISDREKLFFQLARGWLTVEYFDERDLKDSVEELVKHDREPIERARTLLWCMHLAGGGENDYWRITGDLRNAAIYPVQRRIWQLVPVRVPFLSRPALPLWQDQLWTRELMRRAWRMYKNMESYQGPAITRLALANRLALAAADTDPRHYSIRFLLVLTALEAFFIAPDERQYLWDDQIRQRIRSMCGASLVLDDPFFQAMRRYRNDMSHRAGQANPENDRMRCICLPVLAEQVLLMALEWGINDSEKLFTAFQNLVWPDDIPPFRFQPIISSSGCSRCEFTLQA